MLMGEYSYSIDEKGRLNIPAKFREEMGASFVVTRWLDHCLVAFPMDVFEQVADSFSQRGMAKSRDIQRFLFSAAETVKPDKQGRILLPAPLRDHAGITKEVTIIGNRNHLELWDTATWQSYIDNLAENCEDLADAMEELDL